MRRLIEPKGGSLSMPAIRAMIDLLVGDIHFIESQLITIYTCRDSSGMLAKHNGGAEKCTSAGICNLLLVSAVS